MFDLYCTGNNGEKFIVEIQQVSRRFFNDHILYYSANLIREQRKSVAPNWNYLLSEVYVVAFSWEIGFLSSLNLLGSEA